MRAYEFIFEAGPPLGIGPVPPASAQAQQQNAENHLQLVTKGCSYLANQCSVVRFLQLD